MNLPLVMHPKPKKQHLLAENKTSQWVAFSSGSGRTLRTVLMIVTRQEEVASRACSHSRLQNSSRKAEVRLTHLGIVANPSRALVLSLPNAVTL